MENKITRLINQIFERFGNGKEYISLGSAHIDTDEDDMGVYQESWPVIVLNGSRFFYCEAFGDAIIGQNYDEYQAIVNDGYETIEEELITNIKESFKFALEREITPNLKLSENKSILINRKYQAIMVDSHEIEPEEKVLLEFGSYSDHDLEEAKEDQLLEEIKEKVGYLIKDMKEAQAKFFKEMFKVQEMILHSRKPDKAKEILKGINKIFE